MLAQKFTATIQAALLLSLSSCQGLGGIQDGTKLTPEPQDAETVAVHTSAPATLEAARAIAVEQELVGSRGANYSYLDEGANGSPLIVSETFSSRTKYKTITPIIDIKSGSLYVGCTLIRSIEDSEIIAVGNYCRGRSAASKDVIDQAISDEWTHTYSSDFSWLSEAASKVGCPRPQGLEFMGLRILRCQDGDAEEITANISTHILSQDLRIELSMEGFEFAGHIENGSILLFWRLDESSHHEIVRKAIH